VFNVIVTGIASFLTDISTEMVYPLIPLYLAALGAPPAILGVIEGFAESTASVLKVFSGWFSDMLRRRKPVAIAGYAGSTIGKVLLYISHGWGLVFAGRMVDRVGKGIRVAPRDALIADSTPEGKRGKAFGLHRAMDTLGAATGVAISIWLVSTLGHNLAPRDYQRIFLFSLVPAALGVAALLFIRERRKVAAARELPRLSWKCLPAKLKWFLFVVTLFALGNSSNQFLLLRAKNLGMSVLTVLAAYLLYNAVYSILSYPFGHLSDRNGRTRLRALRRVQRAKRRLGEGAGRRYRASGPMRHIRRPPLNPDRRRASPRVPARRRPLESVRRICSVLVRWSPRASRRHRSRRRPLKRAELRRTARLSPARKGPKRGL